MRTSYYSREENVDLHFATLLVLQKFLQGVMTDFFCLSLQLLIFICANGRVNTLWDGTHGAGSVADILPHLCDPLPPAQN